MGLKTEWIALWMMECFAAMVERAKEGKIGDAGAIDRFRAGSGRITESQDLAARFLQRFHDLSPDLEVALERAHQPQAGLEDAPAPPEDPEERFSIEMLAAPAGPCVSCEREVGAGPVGWRRGAEAGPVCNLCLARRSPDLGAVLGVVNFMRQVSRPGTEDEVELMERGRRIVEMARRFAAATADRWPVRPTRMLEGLLETKERMEERHGMFWLDEVKRGRGGGQEPS